MKVILILFFVSVNLFADEYCDSVEFEACDIESMINFLDDCHSTVQKNMIRKMSEDDYVRYGMATWTEYSRIGYDFKYNDYCCDKTLIENIRKKKICDEFLKKFVNGKTIYFEYDLIIRRCYHRYLAGTDIRFDEIMDSVKKLNHDFTELKNYIAKADTVDGIYIPTDIEDSFLHFKDIFYNEVIADFKNKPEREAIAGAYISIGLTIRNVWQLWGGSRLAQYLLEIGINDPDKMSSFILKAYHRHLNGKEFDLKLMLEEYNEERKEYEQK